MSAPDGMGAESEILEVCFVDSPDPDNFMMAAMAVKLRGCRHVVLSGRPANLSVESRSFSPKTCRRTADEVDEPEHSAALMNDFAARLMHFLKEMGCPEGTQLYDGGSAPHAPVTHAEHVHDFLFHRVDLTSSKGKRAILTFDEYKALKSELDAAGAGPLRAKRALDLIARSPYPVPAIESLDLLVKRLDAGTEKLRFLVGSPLTAVRDTLRRLMPATRERLHSVHAQAAAWNVAASNLFPNQFNVACDKEAASVLLTGATDDNEERLRCDVFLVTTELCKTALAVEPAELQAALGSKAAQELYELWHAVTGSPKKLVVFDVGPLLSSWHKDIVPMVPITCRFDDDNVLQLSHAESSNILAAPNNPTDDDIEKCKHYFIEALKRMSHVEPRVEKPEAAPSAAEPETTMATAESTAESPPSATQ